MKKLVSYLIAGALMLSLFPMQSFAAVGVPDLIFIGSTGYTGGTEIAVQLTRRDNVNTYQLPAGWNLDLYYVSSEGENQIMGTNGFELRNGVYYFDAPYRPHDNPGYYSIEMTDDNNAYVYNTTFNVLAAGPSYVGVEEETYDPGDEVLIKIYQRDEASLVELDEQRTSLMIYQGNVLIGEYPDEITNVSRGVYRFVPPQVGGEYTVRMVNDYGQILSTDAFNVVGREFSEEELAQPINILIPADPVEAGNDFTVEFRNAFGELVDVPENWSIYLDFLEDGDANLKRLAIFQVDDLLKRDTGKYWIAGPSSSGNYELSVHKLNEQGESESVMNQNFEVENEPTNFTLAENSYFIGQNVTVRVRGDNSIAKNLNYGWGFDVYRIEDGQQLDSGLNYYVTMREGNSSNKDIDNTGVGIYTFATPAISGDYAIRFYNYAGEIIYIEEFEVLTAAQEDPVSIAVNKATLETGDEIFFQLRTDDNDLVYLPSGWNIAVYKQTTNNPRLVATDDDRVLKALERAYRYIVPSDAGNYLVKLFNENFVEVDSAAFVVTDPYFILDLDSTFIRQGSDLKVELRKGSELIVLPDLVLPELNYLIENRSEEEVAIYDQFMNAVIAANETDDRDYIHLSINAENGQVQYYLPALVADEDIVNVNGSVFLTIPIAEDLKLGSYSITVTDVPTGNTESRIFEVVDESYVASERAIDFDLDATGRIPQVQIGDDNKEYSTICTDMDYEYWGFNYVNSLIANNKFPFTLSGDQVVCRPKIAVKKSTFIAWMLMVFKPEAAVEAQLMSLSAEDIPFDDVDVENPYAPYIVKAFELGIISGENDCALEVNPTNCQFGVDEDVKRSTILKMLFRSLALYEDSDVERHDLEDQYADSDPRDLYSDIDGDEWYYGYLYYASAKGVISGYENGTARMNMAITFGQAAKVIDLTEVVLNENEGL